MQRCAHGRVVDRQQWLLNEAFHCTADVAASRTVEGPLRIVVALARSRPRARRPRFERRLRFLMELTPKTALEPLKPAPQNRRQRLILEPVDGEEQ